jgi:hypothetical protein
MCSHVYEYVYILLWLTAFVFSTFAGSVRAFFIYPSDSHESNAAVSGFHFPFSVATQILHSQKYFLSQTRV